ncbi:hypothetical protein [Thiorhodococcus minor]|uniref:Uncharacterized protein n=1 Tax=Thiorhodococcus minor TaxID=57489 RepID=A0A6M0K5L9_9GAMM|nr:hypothetical protein [Thiorhodococcus minor]NEV65010.1 hypothetical protein [Thiorhodococcus minor]
MGTLSIRADNSKSLYVSRAISIVVRAVASADVKSAFRGFSIMIMIWGASAYAIESASPNMKAGETQEEKFIISEAWLERADANSMETSEGAYHLSTSCRIYLRHGAKIVPATRLSDYVGNRVQFKRVRGKVDWVVIESEEKIQ